MCHKLADQLLGSEETVPRAKRANRNLNTNIEWWLLEAEMNEEYWGSLD